MRDDYYSVHDYYSVPTGRACSRCGVWVMPNCSHYCQFPYQPPVSYPISPVPQITIQQSVSDADIERIAQRVAELLAGSSNGRTSGPDPDGGGSSPSPAVPSSP